MKKSINFHPLSLFLITTMITGCLYLFTTSARLTSANYAIDSGDFLAAILTAGVPHPTGYPTYMLLGILFQKLPIGSQYIRAILVSLVPAALSSGLFALLLRKFFLPKKHWSTFIFSLFVGLIWGLSPFLWSQAIIVEVHGLQSIFIIIALWWVFELMENPIQNSYLNFYLLSLFFGMGLGNHITLSFFLPAVLLAAIKAMRNGFPKRILFYQFLFLLIGLLVYVYIPFRANQIPPINWGNASNWDGFWWLVSGRPYQNLVFDISSAKVISRISALAFFLRQQFGVTGIILAMVGLVQFNFNSKLTRPILLYLFFVFSIFAIIYGTDDSVTYLLTPIAVFALWIGLALPVLFSWTWKKIPVGSILLSLSAISFMVSIPVTFRNVDTHSKTAPADFAETILPQLPPNAILASSSDPDSFPLWYYHFGLGWRPDLTLFTLPLTQFRWYQETLIHTYPAIQFPEPILPISNNSQDWGERVSALNPNLPYCTSSVLKAESTKIQIACSTGEIINFIVN
ncbi:MAG: hypothetical protein CVU46_16455 [Chloroflexi bacterium HGW-Chloroflexi-8]|nr:MAG: hypothetical protein CVU46_16455 [Chloroflexi bacterium HGW-Chloroflexi-8]